MSDTADIGLVINEVAAKGDPLDWFELYNSLSDPIGLFAFTVADDLTDASKRVAFPPGTEIQPGEYLQFEVDSDNWAGFKLGRRRGAGHLAGRRHPGGYGGLGRGGFGRGRELCPHTGRQRGVSDSQQSHAGSGKSTIV